MADAWGVSWGGTFIVWGAGEEQSPVPVYGAPFITIYSRMIEAITAQSEIVDTVSKRSRVVDSISYRSRIVDTISKHSEINENE